MDFADVFKQSQRDTMNGRIPPPFIEEAAGAIEMLEIIGVGGRAPEVEVTNLEVAPEMTGGVAVCFTIVIRPMKFIGQPAHGVVGMDVFRVGGQEFDRFGPESRDALGTVVDVDVEAVRLVVILHPTKDVVVDVAEEMNLGLHSPVVSHIGQCGMSEEKAAVPPTHLMIGTLRGVLYVLLLQDLNGLVIQLSIDPVRHRPVLRRDLLCHA